MINFFKKLFSFNDEFDIDNDNQKYIDLIDYHYKVNNIYGDLILLDLDVDICDLDINDRIKLLNDVYYIKNVEFLPHNANFKYRLTLNKTRITYD